jgi:hypothetical protein
MFIKSLAIILFTAPLTWAQQQQQDQKQKAPTATPKDTCRSLAEAAKNKNFETFMLLSTGFTGPTQTKEGSVSPQSFQKMHSRYLDRLQDLSCKNEIIAADRAVVESESKGEERLIPFVKTNQGWKFDLNTYQAFYHTEEKAKKR